MSENNPSPTDVTNENAATQPQEVSSGATSSPTITVKKTANTTTAKPGAKPTVAKAAVINEAVKKPVVKAGSVVKAAPTAKPVAKVALTTKAPAEKTTDKKAAKPAKEKTPKLKMERDSFTMPKTEYAQLYVLKERLIKLGQPSKKSELLRAGIMQLTAMTDAALKAALSKVPAIKTGRPKKK